MANRITYLQTPTLPKTPVGDEQDSGAVSSVNGQTGAVVLDASDVGALPANTPIPDAVTEQTVAGWGFTKNTGTYSKPASGIPASDLASAVQTSLGKADTALQTAPVQSVNGQTGAVTIPIPTVPAMATDPDMEDWTSGKTVDAAVLKVDFSFASQEIGGLVIAVDELQTAVSQKANSADIPTKTSDLTNDSGYQTATQVQTAIENLQTKAITDTGGYYTTDTVDGALQEIGAELAGINTLIGSGVIS